MLQSSSNPTPELAELLRTGHLVSLHRRVALWSALLKRPYFSVMWNRALMPLLPPRIRIAIPGGPAARVPPWFENDFVHRMRLRDRLVSLDEPFGFRRQGGKDLALGFVSVTRRIAAGLRQDVPGIEVTYPFLHRPLVEFMAAIPFDQKLRPGETRSVMRRSLRGVLPSATLGRRGKGHPNEAIFRAIVRESQRLDGLFTDARVCRRGYVDAAKLADALRLAKAGSQWHSAALVNTIVLETWLRLIESRPAVAVRCAVSGEEHAFAGGAVQERGNLDPRVSRLEA